MGDAPVHINVSRRFLMAADHPPVPTERVVLEVPGAIAIDGELLTAISGLRSQGYMHAVAWAEEAGRALR